MSGNQQKTEPMPPSQSQAGPGTEGPNVSAGSGMTSEPSATPLSGDPGPGTTVPPMDSLGNSTSAPALAGAPDRDDARPAAAVPGKPDGEVDTRV